MGSLRHKSFLIVLALGVFGAFGQDRMIDLKKTQEHMMQNEAAIESMTQKLRNEMQTVNKYKTDKSINPLKNYYLNQSLKAAQALANDIEKLEILKQENNKQIQNEITQYKAILIQLFDQTSEQFQNGTFDKTKALVILKLLQEYELLLNMQKQFGMQNTVIHSVDLHLKNRVESTDLLRSAQDLRTMIKKRIQDYEQEIQNMKKQIFIKKELAKFIDEESFFGEQNFVGQRKTQTSQTTPLQNALSQSKSKDNPNPQDPIDQPSEVIDTQNINDPIVNEQKIATLGDVKTQNQYLENLNRKQDLIINTPGVKAQDTFDLYVQEIKSLNDLLSTVEKNIEHLKTEKSKK